MEDTRSTPTADSMTADAEQITQAQDARTPSSRKRRKDNTSREAHNKYISAAYDRINIALIKGDKSRLQAAAAALDISPTALIIRAVNAYTAAETLTEKAKNPYINK